MPFKKILIVDDSSTARMIIARCFTIAGLNTASYVEAENGIEAVARLDADESIDLVVTDLNMPKMDGSNLIKKLRADAKYAKLPIIVISSVADSSGENAALVPLIQRVIQKPISPVKVKNALEGML